MKKHYLILTLFLLIPFLIFGQKNKAKDVKYGFEKLPSNPLQGEFETYSVLLTGPEFDFSYYGLSKSKLINYLGFQKYKKLDTNGDFEIAITVGRPIIEKKLSKSNGVDEKTKKKWTSYSYGVSYEVPIFYKVYDGKRNIIIDHNTGSGKTLDNSKGFDTKKALDAYITGFQKGLITKLVDNTIYRISNLLINTYDQRYIKDFTTFYTIKKAKKKGLQEFEDAYQQAKSTFATTIAKKVPAETLKTAMKEAVATWEKGLKDFSPTEKKQRQVYEASGYNLANFSIIVGDLDKAETYITKLKKNPKTKTEVKHLSKELKEAIRIRDINIDIPIIFAGKYVEGSISPDQLNAKGGDFILKKSGDKIYGKATFSKKGMVVLIDIETDSGKRSILPKDVIEVVQNGKSWVPLPVISKKQWVTGMVEVLEKNDHITCYKQHIGGTLQLTKVYLLKKGATKPIDVVDFRILSKFDSIMASKFDDCPMVASNFTQGKYERDDPEKSMVQVAKDYHNAMK